MVVGNTVPTTAFRRGAARTSRVTAGVVLLALAIGKSDSIRAQNVGFALETFLRDSIGLDAGQLADAQRGNAVSKILPTKSSRDITVFGIIAVHTTRDAYVARLGDFQRIQALRSAQFGMIGDSVTTADFSGISVDESEYRDLRDCKLNDCNFKLPASSMRQFAQSVDWSAPNAKGQVDSIMRVDLQGFVARYRASGNAAMVRYDDNHGTQSSDVFEALLSQSEYLRDHASELRDYLTTYPVHRPEGAHDAMYWSEDKISRLRRTLTLTHVVVYTPPSGAPLIVRKQIYANHYFDGALELVGAFDAPSLPGGPGLYLVSVRRYSFDNLPSGGFLNIRGRVRNQLANLLQSDLEKERKAIEIPSP